MKIPDPGSPDSDWFAVFDELAALKALRQEHREDLATAAVRLAEMFHQLASTEWPLLDGSAFAADTRFSIKHSEDWFAGHVIREEVRLNLWACSDAIRGWATLIEAQSSLTGAVACSRVVYESCVRIAQLTEVDLGSEGRVQRALTRRIARLDATYRVSKITSETAPPGEVKVIVELAKANGWTVSKRSVGGAHVPRIGPRVTVGEWTEKNQPWGSEQFAWTAPSALLHLEHPEAVVSWMGREHLDEIPAVVTAVWSEGVPAGAFQACAALSKYTGRAVSPRALEDFVAARRAVLTQLS